MHSKNWHLWLGTLITQFGMPILPAYSLFCNTTCPFPWSLDRLVLWNSMKYKNSGGLFWRLPRLEHSPGRRVIAESWCNILSRTLLCAQPTINLFLLSTSQLNMPMCRIIFPPWAMLGSLNPVATHAVSGYEPSTKFGNRCFIPKSPMENGSGLGQCEQHKSLWGRLPRWGPLGRLHSGSHWGRLWLERFPLNILCISISTGFRRLAVSRMLGVWHRAEKTNI